jgi:Xaa-Pro dipeptidase
VRNSPHINHEVLARYENVGGVRIEDVVAITATGCEVLTAVRKDIEWLEAVASGEL